MISIVVPAYDAEATLGACLEALGAQEGIAEHEVIVVDDGSTDATAELARRAGAAVISQGHAGAAAARNRGAAAAHGSLLLFTDADCVPAAGWAAEMSRPFADPSVAGVKGFFTSHQRALVARFVQAEYAEKERHMLGRRSVAFADTAAAAYRTAVFREVGGFRPYLGAVEDTELAFRVAAAGYRLVVAPAALVDHRHPESIVAYARRKLRYGRWGARTYLTYPARVLDDSHTPWSQRLQLVLAPLAVAAAALAFIAMTLDLASPGPAQGAGIARAAIRAAIVMALLFMATTLPFAIHMWRRDPAVSLASPGLFAVRALATATGLAIGIASWARESRSDRVPSATADEPR